MSSPGRYRDANSSWRRERKKGLLPRTPVPQLVRNPNANTIYVKPATASLLNSIGGMFTAAIYRRRVGRVG
ncbi:hypothetical protein BURKHO8Y_50012 [Burkholderia sp. 8Y]|nr:hypothetical protein BURKHO8Y_50012 [Burkholderia sp. 8Y]